MKQPGTHHPSLDLLELYLLNRTEEEEAQKTEEHLLLCEPCRQMAASLERELAFIKSTLESFQCAG